MWSHGYSPQQSGGGSRPAKQMTEATTRSQKEEGLPVRKIKHERQTERLKENGS